MRAQGRLAEASVWPAQAENTAGIETLARELRARHRRERGHATEAQWS